MTRWWLLVQALLLSACTTEHTIGSTCENGICETAVMDSRIPCVLSTAEPIMTSARASDEACLRERVYKSSLNMASCRMFLSMDPPALDCEPIGFSSAEDVGLMNTTVCEIPQLDEAERDETVGFATGWYIEGPPLPAGACSSDAQQRFRLNGPLPVAGTVWLSCGAAFAAPEDVSAAQRMGDEIVSVEPGDCAGLPPLPKRTPDDIGALCEPRLNAPGGFFTDRTYIDVRSQQCTSGVCLVDATQSPSPCEPGAMCAEPSLQDYTYCSCRCDAKGDNSRAPCSCPMGFTCANQLLAADVVPDAVAGSYCVREFFL